MDLVRKFGWGWGGGSGQEKKWRNGEAVLLLFKWIWWMFGNGSEEKVEGSLVVV